MPKKKPEGIPVNVKITLPGKLNDGEIQTTIYIDHDDPKLIVCAKPTMAELQQAVNVAVLDRLQVASNTVRCCVSMDGGRPDDAENYINVTLDNEEIENITSEWFGNQLAGNAKIQIRNGREALAAIKAAAKAAAKTA